jgi:hypothetical protein
MRHVERAELYESLQARLTYLQDFLEFGPGKPPSQQRALPSKSKIPAAQSTNTDRASGH